MKTPQPSEPFFLAQTRAGFEREQIARKLGIPFVGPYYQLFYTPQDEVAFNQALLSQCLDRIPQPSGTFCRMRREEPLLQLLVSRQETAVDAAERGSCRCPCSDWLSQASWFCGSAASCARQAIVLLYILYIPAVEAPIIAHARHSMLIVPFLAILAAASLVSAWQALRVKNPSALLKEIVASGTTGRTNG